MSGKRSNTTTKNEVIWIEIMKRRSTLLFTFLARKGESIQANTKRALGIDFSIPNAKEVDTRIIFDVKSADKFRALILNKVKKDTKYFSEHAKKCLVACKKLLNLSTKISKIEVSKLGNKELESTYKKYIDCTLELMPFLNSFVFLTDILTKMIKPGLEKEGLGKVSLEEIVVPSKLNFVTQEIEDVLKITSQIEKKHKLRDVVLKGDKNQIRGFLRKNKKIESLINNHVKKFGWITSLAYIGEFMSTDDIIKRLKNLLLEDSQKKLTDAKLRRQKARRKFNKLLKNPKLSLRTKQLLKIASQYLWLRFYRSDVLWTAHYQVVNLYQEMARRLGIVYDEILYLTHEEILESLSKRLIVSKNEIRKRQKRFALIMINGKTKIYSGDKVDKLIEETGPRKGKVVDEKIKGTVACRGKAKGKVKIVMDVESMRKVKKGDVLVTNMTTPDLMLAIEKVTAIVTDEGGMLCHAAIISRELDIPCVIATQNATKLLNDGDLVEVDAIKGEVIILSS